MPRPCELFLGGLSKETRRADLEDIFAKYGRVTRCDIKYVNGYAGTAYGFIGYEDDRDAEDAIKNENGRKVCGSAIVIERSKSKPWNKATKVSSRSRDDRSAKYGYKRSQRSRSRSPRSRSRDRHRRRRHRSRTQSRSHSRSRRNGHKSSRRDRTKSRSRSVSRSRSRSRLRSKSKSRDRNLKSNDVNDAKSPVQNNNDEQRMENNDFETDLHEENSANGISISSETTNNQINTMNGDELLEENKSESHERGDNYDENGNENENADNESNCNRSDNEDSQINGDEN